MNLDELPTPSLILDRNCLQRNAEAMTARLKGHGVALRPHMKTAKSIEVARLALAGNFGGITVSTLEEARYFARNGITDIVYGVGIVPAKLDFLAEIQGKIGENALISVILDNPGVARNVAARAQALGSSFEVLIELDCGGDRAGVPVGDAERLLAVAAGLQQGGGVALKGVMTHAGHSYHCHGKAEIESVAEQERAGLVWAAECLGAAGLPCDVVSGGSTPTAVFAKNLNGISEMRPGVYMFGDVMQQEIGTCSGEDIAVTVLASVIGRGGRSGNEHLLLDAGALALSKDRGADEFSPDAGFGLVFDIENRSFQGLSVSDAHQEHGLATGPSLPALEIGERVRIRPIHSCLTTAMYQRYHVVEGGRQVVAVWERTGGW